IEALSGATPTSTQTAATPALGPRWMKRRELIAWIAAAIFLLAFLAVLPIVIAHLRRAPVETPAARFFIYPPEKATFSAPPTVSPDGRPVLLRCNSEGKTLLWVRALNSLTAQRLAGTEDATFAFWSHDSRFIGFYSGGKLKKIEATGGPAQPLCDAPQGSSGGAWNAEGVIIFHPRFS